MRRMKNSFTAWRSRVLAIAALIREGKSSEAFNLAPSVFQHCFLMLARLYADPAAEPTEEDFREYRDKTGTRERPKTDARMPCAGEGAAMRHVRRGGSTPTALSSFRDCLKLKEKPPGMSDARWRMIQSYKRDCARYDSLV